MMKCKLSLKK